MTLYRELNICGLLGFYSWYQLLKYWTNICSNLRIRIICFSWNKYQMMHWFLIFHLFEPWKCFIFVCNERKTFQASVSAGACLKAWWSYTCILTVKAFLIPFYTGILPLLWFLFKHLKSPHALPSFNPNLPLFL